VVATLALLGVVIFLPAYLLPSLLGVAVLGLSPVLLQFYRRRSAGSQKGTRGAAAYGVHGLSRTKATIEAYNSVENPDVPELVDYILQQATLQQASDIHLVPYRDFVLVRYRIDGILTDVAQLGPGLRDLATNRLKVMAQVVSFVHDRPQDGRIDLRVAERDVDLRVAFMPTLHGERIVMRILDRSELAFGLVSLGFTEEQLAVFSDLIFRPQGMVILNGPAGSGKTTTIYAVLKAIL